MHDWGLGWNIVGHRSCAAGNPGCTQLSMGRGMPMAVLRLHTSGGTGFTGPDAGGEQGAHSGIRGVHHEALAGAGEMHRIGRGRTR